MKTRLKKENMIQCNQCGGIWTDNSNLCGSCEQIRQSNHYNKLVKIGIIAGLSVGAVICAGTGISYAADSQKLQQSELNPVIHSSEDITDDLLQRILDNSIDSLTIDYEFTKCDNAPYDPEIIDKIKSSNPFWRANNIRPLQHIKFEVKLTSNVHSLDCAFEYLNKLEYVNLKVTSNVTSMRGMFKYSVLFNQPIGDWNTSKVTNMREMFRNAKSFNQPIGNWDTSNVTDMECMFCWAESFNQPIGNWNTSNVTNMSYMFTMTSSFNQPLGNWDTSNVIDMKYMFHVTQKFNQPIGNWNTSNVTDMSMMFCGSKAFNQPIGNWNTSNVTSMRAMFWNALSFNQPVNNWDTSKVSNMDMMFKDAISYEFPKPKGAK